MLDPEDTICAVASPTGSSLRGVVRVSGPATLPLLSRILYSSSERATPITDLGTRTTAHRIVARIDTATPIGLVDVDVLLWPNHRSYTGQPSAELHTIGGEPILQVIVDVLVRAGARVAGRGEFTLRSFLAGRLDLVQAEAVLGVIDADTNTGLGVALDQLTGGISTPLQAIRHQLLDLLADVEAGLDFVDEDISFIDDPQLSRRLSELSDAVRGSADKMASRGRAGECPLVALCGLPNAGKSRLMNALTGLESSIVSDRVGTTRDPVEVRLDFGQRSWRIVDTAGLEALRGPDAAFATISDQAQRLGQEIAAGADVRLWCQDATVPIESQRPWDRSEIRVATKVDQIDAPAQGRLRDEGWVLTSGLTGLGLESLVAEISRRTDAPEGATGIAATAIRCRETLFDAARGLAAAAEITAVGGGHELVAAELRMALDAVGRVTGVIYTDDILDSIFSRFCIGK